MGLVGTTVPHRVQIFVGNEHYYMVPLLNYGVTVCNNNLIPRTIAPIVVPGGNFMSSTIRPTTLKCFHHHEQ